MHVFQSGWQWKNLVGAVVLAFQPGPASSAAGLETRAIPNTRLVVEVPEGFLPTPFGSKLEDAGREISVTAGEYPAAACENLDVQRVTASLTRFGYVEPQPVLAEPPPIGLLLEATHRTGEEDRIALILERVEGEFCIVAAIETPRRKLTDGSVTRTEIIEILRSLRVRPISQ